MVTFINKYQITNTTMAETFVLPGAEGFSSYLETALDGTLTTEGPEVIGRSYSETKKWTVLLDGEVLGDYIAFSLRPGETEFSREFKGRIPGYVNEAVLIHNKHSSLEDQIPEDTVNLVFDNQIFKQGSFRLGEHGRFIDTEWQRQDGHSIVAFP